MPTLFFVRREASGVVARPSFSAGRIGALEARISPFYTKRLAWWVFGAYWSTVALTLRSSRSSRSTAANVTRPVVGCCTRRPRSTIRATFLCLCRPCDSGLRIGGTSRQCWPARLPSTIKRWTGSRQLADVQFFRYPFARDDHCRGDRVQRVSPFRYWSAPREELDATDGGTRFTRPTLRPPWRSVNCDSTAVRPSRNATEGVPYRPARKC